MNRKYTLLALIIIVLGVISIVFVVILNSINIKVAYIPDEKLSHGWYEDTSLRSSSSYILGFEQCRSITYKFNNDSSAILVVITVKSLGWLNSKQLEEKIDYFLEYNIKDKNITINESMKKRGERVHPNGHRAVYILSRGTYQEENITFNVELIGEAWNCDISGTSIICIGYACTTRINDNRVYEDKSRYRAMVADQLASVDGIRGEGLIVNVACH
ncbi:MAG: hypothetical protein QXS02_04430 [Candidatus Thermoplasmatota archaeon]